jgi:hypothetical protein
VPSLRSLGREGEAPVRDLKSRSLGSRTGPSDLIKKNIKVILSLRTEACCASLRVEPKALEKGHLVKGQARLINNKKRKRG